MDAMLTMLNKGDYYRYITLSKLHNVNMNGESNLLSLLKPHKAICEICCNDETECVDTFCKHSLCVTCLNEIIISENSSCPMCRKSLFIS